MRSHPVPAKMLAIELTNHCNLTCAHCPQGKVSVPKGYMDRPTFMQCLEYCEGYTEMNWRGEPLLHPRLVEYVGIAMRFKGSLQLGIHTNATLMDESLFKALTDNGLNWMHISLHTPESCMKYMHLKDWNSKLYRPIHIYAEVDNSQEELTALSFGLSENTFQRSQLANWGGFLTNYRAVHTDVMSYSKNCEMVRDNKFIIAWDGKVNACCWDYQQFHSLGHVKDFAHIRHNPPYKLCSSCLWIYFVPHLIEENYKGFNVVTFRDNRKKYHGVAQKLGPLDLGQIDEQEIQHFRGNKSWFTAGSIDELKTLIDVHLDRSSI
jgi:hypothetical protein